MTVSNSIGKTLKPIGHNKKYVATPRHWNCRSQHIPEDFDGKKIERVGFEDWFKDLSNKAQDSLLGSRGGDLYRNQQVPLLNLLKRDSVPNSWADIVDYAFYGE